MDSDHDIKTRVTTLEELKVQRKGDECLVVIYAPVPSDLGRRHVLDRELVTIGRDRENDIVLDSDSVSRRHARVERLSELWTKHSAAGSYECRCRSVRVLS